MKQNKSLASLIFIVILAVGAAFVYARHGVTLNLEIAPALAGLTGGR